MASEAPTPRPFNQAGPMRPQPPAVPPGTGTLGMVLFLLSLFMLFAAAMVGYAAIRLAGHKSPAAGSLHFPHIFWLSTAFVIGVSISMGAAVSAVRRQQLSALRVWLLISMILAIGFLCVQAPAMATLLIEHQRLRAAGLFLYGLVFVLVLLHALHVLGGMIALGRVTWQSRRGIYDHEHYQPVRHTAMYWHFLDVIWILMFLTFLLTA